MTIKINNIEVDENDTIFFLDIDGVLNYGSYRDRILAYEKKFIAQGLTPPTLSQLEELRHEARFFSKKAINNLEEIIFSSKGWIVISSDRQNKLSVADLKYIFSDYRFSERIIDKTIEGEVARGVGEGRGVNILNWLKRYPMIQRKMAIDDLNLEKFFGEDFIDCAKDGNSYGLDDPDLVKISLKKLGVDPIKSFKDYSYLEEDAYKDLGNLNEFFTCIKMGDLESLRKKNYPEVFYDLREYDQTCFHIAVANGQTDIVRFFLEKGLSPNRKDLEFRTPLHTFIGTIHPKKYFNEEGELYHKDILKMLIQAGVDSSQKSSYGYTALGGVDLAIRTRIQEVIDSYLNENLNSLEAHPIENTNCDTTNSAEEQVAYVFSLSGSKRKRNTDSQKETVENNNNNSNSATLVEESVVKELKL